jgi:putative Flp pilus-assembly TadE/G-like protein
MMLTSGGLGTGTRGRRGERGQTILLVAISIVSLLMMAALAIDVVSLYVASAEIQRSADAAALTGAKAMADSGVTTLPSTDGNVGNAEILAQAMATSAINAIVQATPAVNQVAGASPVQLAGSPLFSWTQGNNNPHVTVTLQQTNLPTFFARVFGSKSAIATASATAEAYNPANQQSFTPIQTTCVKPWLIGNMDPNNIPTPFVSVGTGQVEDPVPIGEQIWLSSDCNTGGLDACSGLHFTPPKAVAAAAPLPAFLYFVPAQVTTNPGDVCPASTTSPCGPGRHTDKLAIECCNVTAYTCGGTVTNANWDQTYNPEHNGANSDLAEGTECLIHASGAFSGQGQDTLDWSTAPFPTGPPRITAGSGPQAGNLVSTSSSIVTIPILDNSTFSPSSPQVIVAGFLQAFVNFVDMGVGGQFAGHHGDVNITVLNVIGCSTTPNANNPVVGGNGASAIPVRLITPP